MNFSNITKRGHKLLTLQTCQCDKRSDQQCPVCDWGLAVCEWCGAAECELNERDCTGRPASTPLDPDTRDMFARMESLYHYRKGRGKFITSNQPEEKP